MAIFTDRQLAGISEFQDNALDSLAKEHRLYFPSKMIPCSHLLLPASSTAASNAGLHGGPLPTICALCGGTGKVAQEVTETIMLEVDYSPRNTPKVVQVDAPSVKLPWDLVLVKGYLTDLPKLQQCSEIQLNLPTFPITSGRYKLSGDGLDCFNIIKNRHFLAILVRLS